MEGSPGGLVSCACWDHHATLKCEKSGFFLLTSAGAFLLCISVPYLTVIIRNSMQAFLPFISQAGGEPPTNGMFTVFIAVGVFFGLFAFLLMFVTIEHRNVKKLSIIKHLNLVALFSIIVAGIGLVITSVNPVGYTDLPNKFEWVVTVLYGHGTGAFLILVGMVLYQYVVTVIWWYLPDTSKREKYVEIVVGILFFLLFLTTLYPLPAYIFQQIGSNPFDYQTMKTVSYALPREYTIIYQICSVCEWAVVIITIINLATFLKDLQRVSCRIVFRHKSCLTEEMEALPSISLKVFS